jgi:hypothetical protein
MIKYLRTAAAGSGLCSTITYLRGAADVGLGTTIKYLRRAANAAASNGVGTTAKYLVNRNAGTGNNWAKAQHVARVLSVGCTRGALLFGSCVGLFLFADERVGDFGDVAVVFFD